MADVTSMIVERVKERVSKLGAMERKELDDEFFRIYGVVPYPRLPRDFVQQAIAGVYQDEEWIKETGSLPESVTQRNMRFWGKRAVPFLNKGAKEEFSTEMIRNVTSTSIEVDESAVTSKGIRCFKFKIGNDQAVPAKPGIATIMAILSKRTDSMTYDDLESAFWKIEGRRSNLSPMLMLAKRDGIVIFENQEAPVKKIKVVESEEDLPAMSKVMADHVPSGTDVILGDSSYRQDSKSTLDVMMG